MYEFDSVVKWRHIALAVVISLVLSLSVYFVFDVLPHRNQKQVAFAADASEDSLRIDIVRLIQDGLLGRFTDRTVELNELTLRIEMIDSDACDRGLSFFSKAIELNLQTLETELHSVDQDFYGPKDDSRFGRIPARGIITWRFTNEYAKKAAPYAKELAELIDLERRRVGWGEAAAHEATTTFLARNGEDVVDNWEIMRYCSARRALKIYSHEFTVGLTPDEARQLIERMHTYKTIITDRHIKGESHTYQNMLQ